jgi:eukaryotic translation initiation factor 2C
VILAKNFLMYRATCFSILDYYVLPFCRAQKEFKITIEIVGKTNLYHLQRFLLGKHRGIAQEIIHVFDVILSDKLSRNHVTGPRSFLCTQIGHQGYIGDGLDSWRGYHQSLRLRKIGISLNTGTSVQLLLISFH